jgi:hypothetical protein
MQEETEITVNGTKLTDSEAMIKRLAVVTFANILAEDLGFKDDSIALTARYQADLGHIRALMDRRSR